MIFLETLTMDPNAAALIGGGLFAFIMGMLIFVLIASVALWLYSSFVFMAIAKKAKYASAGLAWIPVIGPLIVTNRISGMHWWPILLIIGVFIPVIGGLFSLALTVFFIIWLYKTFEVIGKPGWLAILMIVPVVNLVILGIVAWGK